jgi:ribonuclease HI
LTATHKHSPGVIYLYTDGASTRTPKCGGWGYVLLFNEHRKLCCGGGPDYTSNAMELMAIRKGLEAIKSTPKPIRVFSDSKYAIASIFHYAEGWKRNGWRTSTGTWVMNRHIIEPAMEQVRRLRASGTLSAKWVKGHSGVTYNEVADRLAGLGKKRFSTRHGAMEHEELAAAMDWANGWLP